MRTTWMWSNMYQHTLFNCALVGILVIFWPVQSHTIVRYKAHYQGDYRIDGGNLTCDCGDLKKETKPINSTIMQDIINGNVELESCPKKYSETVCDLLSSCKNCTIRAENCEKKQASEKKQTKSILKCNKEFYDLGKYYYGEIIYTPEENSKNRTERSGRVCGYPKNLKTADVSCRIGPKSVKCIQTCIRGYTLPGGRKKKLVCKNSENKWKPSGFRECRPSVDCGLTLKSPGSFDCYTATTRQNVLCNVKCQRYEDKKAVPRRAYECSTKGKWNKKLPHCVSKGSGLQLVREYAGNRRYYPG